MEKKCSVLREVSINHYTPVQDWRQAGFDFAFGAMAAGAAIWIVGTLAIEAIKFIAGYL